jgi:MoaD family protein
MRVSYYIPAFLRPFTDGETRVEIETPAATVDEALRALWKRYPGVRDRVVNEQGEVRQHVNVFLGEESIRYSGGLETPMRAGKEIAIVPAVSGG